MSHRLAVVGLGYVGLPLALEFGKVFRTIGFDVSEAKVSAYRQAVDPTAEQPPSAFEAADRLGFTTDPADLAEIDVFVVAVPTPVDEAHRPDFSPLIAASRTVGGVMKRGAIVVFESTVYPGATEEVCVPILESASGLKWPKDFNVGYSPERINPGDKVHTLPNIVKVVAGDTPATLETLATIYGAVVPAGIHRASSIKVAEAAKVIENTQRDLNIALMNELAMIFKRLDIDTLEVLEAAGTKWNFLPFRPGLVGGHCIGVDPYYLTTKAEMVGYSPQVILAGRRINDAIGAYIARQVVKEMVSAGFKINDEPILMLGLTFKENVADVRNSKAIDIVRELRTYGAKVCVHDPMADRDEAHREYGVTLTDWDDLPRAGAIVAAVNHAEYARMGLERLALKALPGALFCDVKSAYDAAALRALGLKVWRL
ncbi:MAG: nucleotide sugar dehydrogenase [Lautropia sp.]